jgi:hypothetical protein
MNPPARVVQSILFALGLLTGACAGPGSDTSEQVVTERNLLASERFWPYRVALVEPWEGTGGPIPRGMTGVLIRAEPSGRPRIDFGSRGKHEIPVRHTDLLERANRIRTGALVKDEPNFIHAIKTRMLDSASEQPRPLPPEAVARSRGFLCVFADPDGADFDELARALAPLRERSQVLTILFAQGRHPHERTRERLRVLGWPVPFLYDHLAEPYTRSLLAEGDRLPTLLLQTAEGRLIYQGSWSSNSASDLVAAWDEAFGAPPAVQ